MKQVELFNEEWRDIKDYPAYEVSNFGALRDHKSDGTR